MNDLTAWAEPTGPLEFTITIEGSSAILTMTVTTKKGGNVHYLSVSAQAAELRELARRLSEAADRIES